MRCNILSISSMGSGENRKKNESNTNDNSDTVFCIRVTKMQNAVHYRFKFPNRTFIYVNMEFSMVFCHFVKSQRVIRLWCVLSLFVRIYRALSVGKWHPEHEMYKQYSQSN